MSTPTPTTKMPESPELPLEGQTVGEYVVEGRLGRGAFGTVYKGVHPLIGKAVAIKVLSRRFSADPEMVSRFVAEARAVNQIRHRHIIDIFSFGQLEDGRHYYVMEYLEGETLQALLEREHRLSVAQCLTILRAIGRALDAAHAKGIAHRDLKAENIFLGTDADGGVWPKLLDFGIAKLCNPEDGLTHKTRSGISIGTPLYMSPEQCHGRQVDHRTDIYAFGILVYLMLTGVFPFDGNSYMEILMKQVGVAAAPPSDHVPELPESIDEVVLWLMHKDPAQRPPDLKTAVVVLEQAAERAGLVTPTAWINTWDEAAGSARTQPAKIVVPHSSSAPAWNVFAAARKAAPGWAPGASRTGGGARGAGRSSGGSIATSATLTEIPRSGKAPIIAAASLLVIMVSVAAAVALYPRTDNGSDHIATQRAQEGQGQAQPGQAQQEPQRQGQPGKPPVDQPAQGAPQSGPGTRQFTPGVPRPAQGAPQLVVVTIAGVPAGTAVVAGGHRVGVAPGQVQLPYGADPLALTFQANGYLPAGRAIVPDRDRSLSLTLAKQPSARGDKRTTKDDLINPFGGDLP